LDRGPLDYNRREKASGSLGRFCESYGKRSFFLRWAPYHIRAIDKFEGAIWEGDPFAFAMPRGSGKSTLCRFGVIWAILNGHSRYAVLIGATAKSSSKRLNGIKSVLAHTPELFEDYPEVCASVRHINNESRRAAGQKFKGELSGIEWGQEQIVLPSTDLEYSKSNESVIDVTGIEGEIRGRERALRTGETIRPDVAVADDPQTRESAKSPAMSEMRESVMKSDVEYMAGPDKPIGVVMPCTVIYKGDMADRMLDRKLNPEWRGERTCLVEEFPKNMSMWDDYWSIRYESLRNDQGVGEANEFYKKNQHVMDEGAVVVWEDRKFPNEISAIQHAMNKYLKDPVSFQSEYQNDPYDDVEENANTFTSDDILNRMLETKRRVIPDECNRITAFIDISEKVLWWVVTAWGEGFTGCVVDCGVYPDQKTSYTTLQSVKRTLKQKHPGMGFEAALRASLDSLCEQILDREYFNESGIAMSVNRCMIDANWGQSTDVVYTFCRRSKWASTLYPSHGVGITATRQPLVDTSKKPKRGERWGEQWKINKGRGQMKVVYDTNHWKTHVANRLSVPIGDPGSLTIYQDRASSLRMLSEQMASERSIRVEANGRVVDQWDVKKPGIDNHLWDGVVGCAVGASIEGVGLKETKQGGKKKRETVRLSDLRRGK